MSTNNVQNAHISQQLRHLHSALLEIVAVMNEPQRDEVLIQAAGIRLDRALFPLLVVIERAGPIGVVDLADRVGRDYTTVSRQVAKLEALELVERREYERDRRVRVAVISAKGKAMTERIDAAREKIGRKILSSWSATEIEDLVRLMQRFASAMRTEEAPSASDESNRG